MPRPRWKTALALGVGLVYAAVSATQVGPVPGALALVGAAANPLVPEDGWGRWGRPLAQGLILAAALILIVELGVQLVQADKSLAWTLRALLLLSPIAIVDDRLLARPIPQGPTPPEPPIPEPV